MSVYINNLGEYPRFIGDIQLAAPGWQEGDSLPDGWSEVIEVLGPTTDENHTYYEVAPLQVDGIWTQQWEIRELTSDEIARRDARATLMEKLSNVIGLNQYEIDVLFRGR